MNQCTVQRNDGTESSKSIDDDDDDNDDDDNDDGSLPEGRVIGFYATRG